MSEVKESQNLIIKTLNWAYDKSISPAIEMGDNYLDGVGTMNEKVNRLIRNQIVKTSATGFVTGLGGLITLPISLPADVAGTIYVQTKMIAAIAHMGGYDIRDDKVKTLVYVCLVGDSVKDILSEIGVDIGKNIARKSLTRVSGKAMSRMLPIVGGVICGTINGLTTKTIGAIAKKTFIAKATEAQTD